MARDTGTGMRPVSSYHDLVRREIFPLLPQRAGVVLDFGGGVGATSASLRESGRAERAVLFDQVADKSVPQIDAAEALDLNDIESVGAALDRHGPFDTVLCLDILEHLVDPWSVVERLHRAIKPGGTMIISLPNVNHLSVVAPLVLEGRFDYVDAGIRDRTHLRWFTPSGAVALATCSGMELEAKIALLGRRMEIWLNRVSLGVFERFFAKQYCLRVRKARA